MGKTTLQHGGGGGKCCTPLNAKETFGETVNNFFPLLLLRGREGSVSAGTSYMQAV